MMQSISHWGQFEMQAAGTENFREHIKPAIQPTWKAEQHKPTSLYVSRQDKPVDPKLHEFY